MNARTNHLHIGALSLAWTGVVGSLLLWWFTSACVWVSIRGIGTAEPKSGSLIRELVWLGESVAQWRFQILLAAAVALVAIKLLRGRWIFPFGLWLLTSGWSLGELASQDRVWRTHQENPGLRLFVYNGNSLNSSVDSIVREIQRTNSDIAVVCEMNQEFVRSFYTRGPGELNHVAVRAPKPDVHGWIMVLSRWPITDLGNDDQPTMRVSVKAPFGPFEVVGLHLPSPRTRDRWVRGDEIVRGIKPSGNGLPLLIAGDLNASPWGARDRIARRHLGIRRAKPALSPGGTFPSMLPWPARIPIDGVWMDDSWRVSSWDVGSPAGSDHAPVIVELVLDAGEGVDRSGERADTPGGRVPGGWSG